MRYPSCCRTRLPSRGEPTRQSKPPHPPFGHPLPERGEGNRSRGSHVSCSAPPFWRGVGPHRGTKPAGTPLHGKTDFSATEPSGRACWVRSVASWTAGRSRGPSTELRAGVLGSVGRDLPLRNFGRTRVGYDRCECAVGAVEDWRTIGVAQSWPMSCDASAETNSRRGTKMQDTVRGVRRASVS
jgi:hypothetical protein